jgi:hypothetical protein
MTDPTPQEEQDLVALVDGRLDAERRAALEARAQEDPALAAAIARQRAAVAMIAGAAEDVSAPLALRAAVERMTQKPARRGLRERFGIRAWLAPVIAAAAAAVAIIAVSGNGPAIGDVVAAAVRPPVAAISPVGGQQKLLREQVDGVRFPDFSEKFARRATGQRTDSIGGRPTRTVFYGDDLAYTIVGGEALTEPDGARTTTREGTRIQSFTRDGRTVVTWRRQGHTCVLSSRTVPREQLLELAAWRGKGGVPF